MKWQGKHIPSYQKYFFQGQVNILRVRKSILKVSTNAQGQGKYIQGQGYFSEFRY